MKVLLVDDEHLARERLQRLMQKLFPAAEIDEAGNGQQALEKVASWQPDLLLLDIRMPVMDGIAVAEALQDIEQAPAIVFCTAYDDYALDALERQAVAYLLKPVREEALKNAVERAGKLNRMQLSRLAPSEERRSHISAQTHKGLEMIALEQVRCFVAEQKYVRAVFPDGELIIPDTLKELESEFAANFVRVHRGALANLSHVSGLVKREDQWMIQLDGVDVAPTVSRRHLSEVKQRLRER